ncbi:MAG: folate-binding protein [Pseudomonadota bacterium]
MTEGFALLTDRAVIHLRGADVFSLLNGVVTQRVEPGMGPAFSAVLTPQGKIIADFHLVPDGDGGLFVDVTQESAAALAKRITLYKLRADVTIEPRADLGVYWSAEPGAAPADPRLAALGARRVDRADPSAPDAAAAYRAHRYRLGVPEMGDFGPEDVFPLDVNYDALCGVDYKKGCFVGQEVASRMKRKGDVRKRALIVEGRAPLAPGAAILAGAASVGTVLGADADRALALVRLDRLAAAREKDDETTADGGPVRLITPDYLETA